MKRLLEKEYWDAVYTTTQAGASTHEPASRIIGFIKWWCRDYANAYLLREQLIPRFIPRGDLKTIEIGCAPGGNLLYFHQALGHDVYGVEYTPQGVATTRARFVAHNLNPSNIIEADFFDDAFLEAHREKYDVVYSKGFIEHFDEPGAVVERHIALLRPGGYLIVLIPNLNGLNRHIANALDAHSLGIHNTSIMRKDAFEKLFPASSVQVLWCGYAGVFHIGLFTTDAVWKARVQGILRKFQMLLNFLFRVVFRTHGPESRFLSPYLVYIGKRH